MMAVFRVNKTKDYTTMSNYHFREKEMTNKSKGLLSLMLSLPDDWDYSEKGLSELSKDSLDGIKTELKELEQFGYLKRKQIRDEKGIFGKCVYDIYEKPMLEKPITGKPTTGKPITEKPTQLNTNILNTKELNTKKEIHKEKYGTYGRVKLTINEYLRLREEFGEDFIKNQIELLDEYIESNNNKNKYTNFNLVLRKSIRENWFKQKQEKGAKHNVFLDIMKEDYDNRANN